MSYDLTGCPKCKSMKVESVVQEGDRRYSEDTRCTACGFVWTDFDAGYARAVDGEEVFVVEDSLLEAALTVCAAWDSDRLVTAVQNLQLRIEATIGERQTDAAVSAIQAEMRGDLDQVG